MQGGKGYQGMNVWQDWSKMPKPMPKEGEVEVEEDVGGKMGAGAEKSKKATGKDALADEARLKAWFSS